MHRSTPPKCPKRDRWVVVQEAGLVHVALENGDGERLEYISSPSGPTRYGTIQNAKDAARAANERLNR